jgi:hypothetical protein
MELEHPKAANINGKKEHNPHHPDGKANHGFDQRRSFL